MTVQTGLERLMASPPDSLAGAAVGLLTNPSGITADFQSAVDLLHRSDAVKLAAIFGPEHGVRGDAQAGEHVGSATDARTGLPLHSLYGATMTPTAEMLAGLDALLIDLQDIGVRYATYATSVARAIDGCASARVRVVILDRPNPLNGETVQGNLLDPAFISTVGSDRVTIRHGLTLGELGVFYARERSLPEPEIVRMRGWRRRDWYDETGLPWVLPSPNLPTLETVVLYPGTCLIEGTNLSEGRGTTKPFELIGAPWLDPDRLADRLRRSWLSGVAFRPAWFTPTFSKHAGQRCGGVQIHVTDRTQLDAAALGVHLLAAVMAEDPESFQWLPPFGEGRPSFIDLLAGGDALRTTLDQRGPVTELLARWREEARAFARQREDLLVYHE
jgi:uncharacterized protein YbbC (DUF1343 family)